MALNDWYSGARLDRFPVAARYFFGIVLFGVALWSRFAMVGVLPPEGFPFLTFFPAVLITALLAGLGPGLLVSILSIFAAWYFFIAPAGSFNELARSDLIALLFFAGILVVDCIVIHLMNGALTKVRSTSDQLRVSEAALRDADRQKDVFLATLAHELRNPIAPIRAAAQLIELVGASDDKIRNAAGVIKRQSTQLARLVEDLLDVSRIGSGKLILRRAPVDLRAVVQQAIETCQPLIDASSHRLAIGLPSHPVIAQVDAARLTQCIANLLHNAVKFTQPGGEIVVELSVDSKDRALVRVQDNGRGISSDMIPRLFEVFSQERTSGMDGNSGLGIGLALTRRLVDMHGGEVKVISEGTGKGAIFDILLPLAMDQPAPSSSVLPLQAKARGKQVLIVDDNQDSAEMLRSLLELEGHSVMMAHDGHSALRRLHEHRLEVVVLDLGLPDMSGFDLVRRARAEGLLLPDTLLIALTGWGDERARQESLHSGIDYHFNKPVNMVALLQAMQGRKPERRAAGG